MRIHADLLMPPFLRLPPSIPAPRRSDTFMLPVISLGDPRCRSGILRGGFSLGSQVRLASIGYARFGATACLRKTVRLPQCRWSIRRRHPFLTGTGFSYMLPLAEEAPPERKCTMTTDEKATTPNRFTVRRRLAWWLTGLTIALVTMFPSKAQDVPLNEAQQELLRLEAELAPFRYFQSDLRSIVRDRVRGNAVRQSDLQELKEDARSLLPVAHDLTMEAFDLRDEFSVCCTGELSADDMYFLSAEFLAEVYWEWGLFLERVIAARTTSPPETFILPDSIGEAQERVRIYRVLGNQQYRLDRLDGE